MIDLDNVRAAFERFAENLTLGNHRTQEEAHDAGALMWQSVGMTEEVRVEFYEHATFMLGPDVDPDSLLFGALWALMAAHEAGALPTGETVDWDAALARLTGEGS